MKPHEETWKNDGEGALRAGEVFVAEFADEARLQLAAQAPAMARLLLAFLEQGDPELKEKKALEVLRAAGVLP